MARLLYKREIKGKQFMIKYYVLLDTNHMKRQKFFLKCTVGTTLAPRRMGELEIKVGGLKKGRI